MKICHHACTWQNWTIPVLVKAPSPGFAYTHMHASWSACKHLLAQLIYDYASIPHAIGTPSISRAANTSKRNGNPKPNCEYKEKEDTRTWNSKKSGMPFTQKLLSCCCKKMNHASHATILMCTLGGSEASCWFMSYHQFSQPVSQESGTECG